MLTLLIVSVPEFSRETVKVISSPTLYEYFPFTDFLRLKPKIASSPLTSGVGVTTGVLVIEGVTETVTLGVTETVTDVVGVGVTSLVGVGVTVLVGLGVLVGLVVGVALGFVVGVALGFVVGVALGFVVGVALGFVVAVGVAVGGIHCFAFGPIPQLVPKLRNTGLVCVRPQLYHC